MIDITNEEIWDSDYERKIEKNKQKKGKTNKILTFAVIAFIGILTTNCILIYNFFTLLSKI